MQPGQRVEVKTSSMALWWPGTVRETRVDGSIVVDLDVDSQQLPEFMIVEQAEDIRTI